MKIQENRQVLCVFNNQKFASAKRKEIMMKKVEWIRTTEKLKEISTIAFNSDVFECPNCQNKSNTPCSACGYSPMYRVQ